MRVLIDVDGDYWSENEAGLFESLTEFDDIAPSTFEDVQRRFGPLRIFIEVPTE